MYINAKTIHELLNDATATAKLVQMQKQGGKWVTSSFAVLEAIALLANSIDADEAAELEKKIADCLYQHYIDIRDVPPLTKMVSPVVAATQAQLSLSDAIEQACAAYYEVEVLDLSTVPEPVADLIEPVSEVDFLTIEVSDDTAETSAEEVVAETAVEEDAALDAPSAEEMTSTEVEKSKPEERSSSSKKSTT